MKNKSFTAQKDILDRFYTNEDVALHLVKKAKSHLVSYKNVVEPSAGAGAFINAAKQVLHTNVISFDLKPNCPETIAANWLETEIDLSDTCVIGNPPFGKRSKLAIAFIQHCIDLQASCIAFILPKTFMKPTLQRVFPSNWSLVQIEPLPRDAFTLDGLPYHVECVFQVWEKDTRKMSHRWSDIYTPKPYDFHVVKTQDEADWFVMGAAPGIVKVPNDVSPNNRGYWIKCVTDKYKVKFNLELIDWGEYGHSGVNGGVFWLTKDELLAYYFEEMKDGS